MITAYKNILYPLKEKKLRNKIFITVLLSIIQAILEAVTVLAIPLVLKTLIFKDTYPFKLGSFELNFHGIDPLSLSLICILALVLKNTYTLFFNFYSSKFIAQTNSKLNTNIFSIHLKKPYELFVKTNTSEYIKNITHDIHNYINFSLSPLITLISEFLILIFIFITLLTIDFKLTIIFLFSSIFTYLIFNFFTKKIILQAGKANQMQQSELLRYIKDAYASFKEIYLYNLQIHFISNVEKISQILASGISKNIFYGNIPRVIIESFFMIFILLSLILTLNYSASELVITFGAFGFAALRLIPSLSKIFVSISSIRFGVSSCNVLNSLVDLKYGNLSEDCPQEVKYNDSVNLINVSHKYEKEIVLNNINLNIDSKDFVAIIGDSGSGKTTLLNIILGLTKPERGTVVSNNISIYKSEKTWRSNIGYVPQSINLIDKNIFKNIALGQAENLIDKQKINTLLKDLSISDLALDSSGKDFLLGENANKISGGQSQRIGIAKALYKNPKILILDEFTSALDNENQDKILKLIKELDITVIMVTHRLNSLAYCNKIFEIKNHILVQIK